MDRRSWPWKKKLSEKSLSEKPVAISDVVATSLTSAASLGSQNYKKLNYVQISVESYKHLNGMEDKVNILEDQISVCEDQVKDLQGKLSDALSEVSTKDDLVSTLQNQVSTFEYQVEDLKETLYVVHSEISVKDDMVNMLQNQVSTFEYQVENLKEKLYVVHSERSVRDDMVNTLQNQVSALEYEVNDLKEKVSVARSEISTKDEMVKQHVKVAEEAVSGWEKADAEAHALKQQLESVTLLKLTAEDRVSHLNGALKECTRQIRNVKEEAELHYQEKIISKTMQWDKLKIDFERKLVELDGVLLQATAEKVALSRSLKEHMNTIVRITEEKSQAGAEVELLKSHMQLYDKEISSLKYELNVVSKELDIRNQEKKLSMKTTEAASKQHLEDAKKIAYLESECQRLRSLVRKKLPGRAALSRMKLEADRQECSEPSSGRNAVKNPNFQPSSKKEFSSDNQKPCLNESELHGRVMEMEEEMKILKEALAARDMELQASTSMLLKTSFMVKSSEAQIQALNQQTRSSSFKIHTEGFSNKAESTPPSVTSISEDGMDEEGSSSESWGPVISDVSQLWRDKSTEKSVKPSSRDHLELMDDFLEMEKLASSSGDSIYTTPNEGIHSIRNKLVAAVSHIQQFVMSLGREVVQIQGIPASGNGFSRMLQDFTASVEKFSCHNLSLADLVLELSSIFVKAGELNLCIRHCKDHGGDTISGDCIDKIPLVENKSIQDESLVKIATENLGSQFGSKAAPCYCSLRGVKHLRTESSSDDLVATKLQLQETQQLLAALKLQLESSEKAHSLAEVQLKCMTESYKSLETRAHSLESEVKVLQEKTQKLEKELLEEKQQHQDILEEIQQKIKRDVKCSVCSSSLAADVSCKTKQEKEVEAAQIAEFQDTIYLLSKQLQALHQYTESEAAE